MSGMMLREAIERSGLQPKDVARQCHYSVDALYAAFSGKRKIPKDAQRQLSQVSLLAGLAVAHEATGYNLFRYQEGDRHIQTLFRRLEREDGEADAAIRRLSFLLLDKNEKEDLTDEELHLLRCDAMEVCHRVRADINLLVELESRFDAGIMEYLNTHEKEKTPRRRG